jgi:hypothetical protein
MSHFLEILTCNVESSADWRAEKAEQYPDDNRNMRSSRALAKLAERLRTLPDNDDNVVAYEAIMGRLADLDDDLTRVTEHESHYIGRYGFDYPQDGDPASFLSDLIEQYHEWVNEAEERIAEEERERAYEEAKETADEAAKEAAHEAAKEAAEEAAKEAAEQAYKEAYDEAYKEAYEEAYRDALIEALEGAT